MTRSQYVALLSFWLVLLVLPGCGGDDHLPPGAPEWQVRNAGWSNPEQRQASLFLVPQPVERSSGGKVNSRHRDVPSVTLQISETQVPVALRVGRWKIGNGYVLTFPYPGNEESQRFRLAISDALGTTVIEGEMGESKQDLGTTMFWCETHAVEQ